MIEDVACTWVDTPITAKRYAQTTVTMGTGATVVIGGLIRDDATRIVKKVPLLGDLPLLGPLFRNQRDQVQKTNLLIFITPHVMASQDEWIERSDQKKQRMPPMEVLKD